MGLMLSLIVAMSQNRVIGHKNQLPWHLSEDLKHFKKTTMGHAMVMGRKTFESIGKPLPGRKTIILTSNPNYHPAGTEVLHSLADIIKLKAAPEECFIVGGATLYEQMLVHCERLYLTLIKQDYEGDAYFPDFDLVQDFQIIEESPLQFSDPAQIPYQFVVAERRASPHP